MHKIFGIKHIILFSISFVLIALLFIMARKLKFATVTKIMLYVGIVSETIKIFYYIIQNEEKYGGVLPKTDLPFHLCSIQIIFILILNLSKNEKLKRFLVSFMMPSCLFGGIAAILIATNSSLNGMWIISLQYFAYHVAITVYSLYLATSKEYAPTLQDYFNCLKFLLGMMFVAIYINSIVYDGVSNINFMYVAGPPQDGLPFLNDEKGWLSYILRYAFVIIVAVTLFYIKPIVLKLKEKFKPNNDKTEE